MALHTVFLGTLGGHTPGVRLMAFLTLHADNLYVKRMLTHINDIPVAVEAITPIRSNPCMGFVAGIAIKLHGRIGRHINLNRLFNGVLTWLIMRHIQGSTSDQFFSDILAAVAEKAFLPSRSEVSCSVGVAVEAREFSHADAMDDLALMASDTESLFRGEFVHHVAVAFRALDLFHENVLGMKI